MGFFFLCVVMVVVEPALGKPSAILAMVRMYIVYSEVKCENVKEEEKECVVQRDEMMIITAVLVAGASSSISGWICHPATVRVCIRGLKLGMLV